mgnify:CR=1 FL=1
MRVAVADDRSVSAARARACACAGMRDMGFNLNLYAALSVQQENVTCAKCHNTTFAAASTRHIDRVPGGASP